MNDRQPWLFFDPAGKFDGMIWSPETVQEAQDKLASLMGKPWSTLARAGWFVRRGENDEHHDHTRERIAQLHSAIAEVESP